MTVPRTPNGPVLTGQVHKVRKAKAKTAGVLQVQPEASLHLTGRHWMGYQGKGTLMMAQRPRLSVLCSLIPAHF